MKNLYICKKFATFAKNLRILHYKIRRCAYVYLRMCINRKQL